ncbi:hypothetical protein H0H93_002154 [Arthromyces matolae]|nr:hypothetical protein H0H93_002154 [Arthromyces matolae]
MFDLVFCYPFCWSEAITPPKPSQRLSTMKFTPAPYIAASLLSTLIVVASPVQTWRITPERSNTPNPPDCESLTFRLCLSLVQRRVFMLIAATNFEPTYPAMSSDFVFDTRPFAKNPAYPSHDDGDLPSEQLPNAEIARPSTAPSSSTNKFNRPDGLVRSTTPDGTKRPILTPQSRVKSSQPPQPRVVQFFGAPAATSTDPLKRLTQDMSKMGLVGNSADAPHQGDRRAQKRKKLEGDYTGDFSSACAQHHCEHV